MTQTTTARRGETPAPRSGPPHPTPGAERAGFTTRIAVWSATHRWTTIGLWAVMIVLVAGITAFISPKEATSLDLGVGESGRAAQTAVDAGHPDPVVENALITARSGTLDAADAKTVASELTTQWKALDEVASVTAPVTSKDGSAVLVQATLSGDEDDAADQVPALESVVSSVQADHPDLRVEETGPASINGELQDWIGTQLGKATALSVPLTLAILLVVFGALVMATVPVVLGLSSVAAGLGLWALGSQVLPDPGTVTDLLVLVGMAVGVDYSLFYLRRFREEKRRAAAEGRTATNIDAIRVAAQTAGHSVVVSGCAVVLSMAGLFLAGDKQFAAMATGSILVVLVALVSSVTVLPALLSVLGRWSERPRVPVLWRLSGGRPRVVPALLRRVLARPVAATVASVVVLLALAAPVIGISLSSDDTQDLPRSLATMQGYDRLVAEFPQGAAPDTVVTQVPAGQEAELRTQVAALERAVDADPSVFAGTEKPWFSADGRTAVVPVDAVSGGSDGSGAPGSAANTAARLSVTTLREDVVPATVGSVPGAQANVGGDAAENMDYAANLRHAMPIVAAGVFALTFLVMLISFRSFRVAALTVVLNALSMAATFGILTAVFQGSWAEGLLGFTSTGHVVSWVPMLLFVVLSGLSLDYHVFVVSRIRENARAGMSTRDAILDGVSRTAGTITSAAAVMVGVFSLFGVLGFIELKQFGVGLVVGVVLDATVIRLIVLPATMMLARRGLWWPGMRTAPAGVRHSRGQLRSADK